MKYAASPKAAPLVTLPTETVDTLAASYLLACIRCFNVKHTSFTCEISVRLLFLCRRNWEGIGNSEPGCCAIVGVG